MAKAKQMCDLSPMKGFTTKLSNENLRKANNAAANKRWSGSYDPTREKLNFEVTKGGKVVPVNKNKSIPRRIIEILKERGIKDPNEGQKPPTRNTVGSFILGGSRDQMHRLAFGEQVVNLNPGADNSGITRQKAIEDWAVDVYNFMARKYGEDNIASFVVHLDETNPHVHCAILPIVGKKFSYNKVFGGQRYSKQGNEGAKKMKQLHDEFTIINKKWGLERGDDIKVTGARHRSIEEYHRFLDEQKKELEGDIYNKRLTSSKLDAEISKAERRVKGLATMLSNLEDKKAEIEAEISSLQSQVEEGRMTNDEMEQHKRVLSGQLDAILEKIRERQKQLETARQQLQDATDRKAELEGDIQNYKREYNEVESGAREMLQGIGCYKLANEIKDVLSEIQDRAKEFHFTEKEQTEMYDAWADSNGPENHMSFEDLALCLNEVAAVSSALFLGYIDRATSFAQSHGGGGGGPSSGWGRDKDDDDEAWRRKCFFMGMKMMRPSAGKQSRISLTRNRRGTQHHR